MLREEVLLVRLKKTDYRIYANESCEKSINDDEVSTTCFIASKLLHWLKCMISEKMSVFVPYCFSVLF